MKLMRLALQNYKSHKEFVALFDGNNKLIQGNKGSGKTSLKDAYTWLLTGAMVDDPTPVDENGVIINHLTIAVEADFDDGTNLRIESAQKWVKDVLRSNHESTYFVNGVPCTKTQYMAHLDQIVDLEKRKILIDPSIFADGDGLRVTGKTSKTATQRRREIVISVAGAGDIESKIEENEDKAKQSKYAIAQLKKKIDEAHAGVEALNDSLIDVSSYDKEELEQSIANLEQEKANANQSIESLSSGNESHNVLKQAYYDAQNRLNEAKVKYNEDYTNLLSKSNEPMNAYQQQKQGLETQLQQALFSEKQALDREHQLITVLSQKESNRNKLLDEHKEVSQKVYVPGSVTCQTCGQGLPVEMLQSAEARFNKNKSDRLEVIIAEGTANGEEINRLKTELQSLKKDFGSKQIQESIAALVIPTIEHIPTFEETEEYAKLNNELQTAYSSMNSDQPNDDAKNVYLNAIAGFNQKIQDAQADLQHFATNSHIHQSIDKVRTELIELTDKKDEQQEILDACNEFTRKTLAALDEKLQEVFPNIRFKMFDTTLDGEQKDTCITYAKTANGFIPWGSLSGGQKRTATISLANAFSKAWGVYLPLWIDDTQIYADDELNALPQLIRITEVPNAKLEVK